MTKVFNILSSINTCEFSLSLKNTLNRNFVIFLILKILFRMLTIKRISILVFILINFACDDEPLDSALTECNIDGLSVAVGECNDDGTYEAIIDFNTNSNSGSFDLFARNNQLLGNFNISDLPLNIQNFEPSGFANDFIKVCISDENEDCCSEIEFATPDCP